MRLYSLLITSIFVLSEVAMSKPFTYTETEHYDSPSATTTLILEQRLTKHGFMALDQSGLGKIPLINMDQVFQKDGKTIFFKQGLKPTSSQALQEIAGGYVYHAKTDTDVHVALFFDGFTKSEVSSILKKSDIASNVKQKNGLFSFKFSLFPSACAATESCGELPSSIQTLSTTAAHVNTMNISSIAGSCAISALKGAADGAKDLVQGSWAFAKTLFTDPEKLWVETKKTFGELKNLVANFEPRMKQFIESMRNLDPQVAAEIICSTISSIVVQSLIGGGLAKAAIVMTKKFLSLDKIRGALTTLSRLKMRNEPGTTALTSRMVACMQ